MKCAYQKMAGTAIIIVSKIPDMNSAGRITKNDFSL